MNDQIYIIVAIFSGWFKGYGGKQQHAMYRTSGQEYGSRAPTVHNMPKGFYGRSQKFSNVSNAH